MSLTPAELIALLMLIVIVLGGVFGQWVWVKTKWAEMNVRITDVESRMKSDERTNEIRVGELKDTNSRIFKALDEIKDITTDIRIKCAKHEMKV